MSLNLNNTTISGQSQYVDFNGNDVSRIIINDNLSYLRDTVTMKINSVSGSVTATSKRSGTSFARTMTAAIYIPTSTVSVTISLSKPLDRDITLTLSSTISGQAKATSKNSKTASSSSTRTGSNTITIKAGETSVTSSLTAWTTATVTSGTISISTSYISSSYVYYIMTFSLDLSSAYNSAFGVSPSIGANGKSFSGSSTTSGSSSSTTVTATKSLSNSSTTDMSVYL